jgi:cell division protein FtsL
MKTTTKPSMQDIKPPEQKKLVSDTKVKLSPLKKIVRTAKYLNIFVISLLVAKLFMTLTSQNIEIMTLKQQIAEREQATFLVDKNGKETLTVAPKLGEQVKYKGVWINSKVLQEIDKKFGSKAEIFKAILIVESSGGQYHVNHNCRYDSKGNLRTDGTGYSNFCKSDYHAEIGTDSVDCGYLQINFKGTKCPAGVFTPEKQVALAYEKYTEGGCGGLNCWSSYKYDRSKINKVLAK